MELEPSSDRDLRIYGPGFGCEYSSREQDAKQKSRLEAKIHTAYCKALERLMVKARPHIAARFLSGSGGGFCFGLLDPVSNIVANTLIPCHQAKGKALSGEDAVVDIPEAKIVDLVCRSLEGMVTFLTRFFPYLADCEAVCYLLLADADLLVATRIIVMDRRMKRFGFSELAVEEALRMALKCAALVAQHPDPDRLVGAWLTIYSHLDEVVRRLAKVRSSSSNLGKLIRLLDKPMQPVDDRRGDLLRAWQHAMSRRPHPRSVPYQNTSTHLKRTLLDAIHGFYLQALARLPVGSRYHRLLMAGHCYGPLDPVSNIILNTIWYDTLFPPAKDVDLGMIGTECLHRVEARSMYGLVSFLCSRYHHINFHQATRCLLDADGNLLLADPNLDAEAAAAATAALRMGEQGRLHSPWSTTTDFHNSLDGRVDTRGRGPAISVNKAFKAAATAAWHPNPDAQASILASCKPMLGSAISLLQGGDQLSCAKIQQIARLLSPESPFEKPSLPLPLEKHVCVLTTISEKVHAALNVYALTPNGEPMYEHHAICGVNDQVSGPVFCPESGCCPPHKFYRSHVNFLATPKGTNSHADGAPVLFFAELSNDDEGEAQTRSFCCPVFMPLPCAERVRCLYCDFEGTRIVHPTGKNFHGRKEDFEMMVCREDPYDENFDPVLMPQYYTNMNIISNSSIMAEMIGRLQEDGLYSDSCDFDSDESDSDSSDEC